jgi:hypothetical protein
MVPHCGRATVLEIISLYGLARKILLKRWTAASLEA